MRQKRLSVGPEQLAAALKVPQGARIVDAKWNWRNESLVLYLESDSFDAIPAGDPLPFMELEPALSSGQQ